MGSYIERCNEREQVRMNAIVRKVEWKIYRRVRKMQKEWKRKDGKLEGKKGRRKHIES